MTDTIEDIVIITPRLKLREWRATDVPVILELAQQPGFYIHGLQPAIESAQALVDCALERRQLRGPSGNRASFRLAVTQLDGPLLGSVALAQFDPHPQLASFGYELFYFIDPRQQGHGYAEEAARHLLAFAHAQYALNSLFATVDPDNSSSIRTLEKLNFTRHPLDCSFLVKDDGKPRVLYTKDLSL